MMRSNFIQLQVESTRSHGLKVKASKVMPRGVSKAAITERCEPVPLVRATALWGWKAARHTICKGRAKLCVDERQGGCKETAQR